MTNIYITINRYYTNDFRPVRDKAAQKATCHKHESESTKPQHCAFDETVAPQYMSHSDVRVEVHRSELQSCRKSGLNSRSFESWRLSHRDVWQEILDSM